MLGRDGRGTAVVAIALAVALVGGCTGDKTESPAPGTTVASTAVTSSRPSSAAPSGTSVPVSSSSGSSVSSSGTPSVTADPALVAEAKKVNQKQWEVETALVYIGGLPPGSKPPKELAEVMMDEGLSMTMQTMHDAFLIGGTRKSGHAKMTHVQVTEEFDLEGSLVALRSCRDDRQVTFKNRDGSTEPGKLLLFTAYFKRHQDGRLKMNSWASEEVAKCGN